VPEIGSVQEVQIRQTNSSFIAIEQSLPVFVPRRAGKRSDAISDRGDPRLLGLEEQYRNVAKVEVNEVLGFCGWSMSCPSSRYPSARLTMRYETAKVSPNDAMPCRTLFRIKLIIRSAWSSPARYVTNFSFDMLCDVLQQLLALLLLRSPSLGEPFLWCISPLLPGLYLVQSRVFML